VETAAKIQQKYKVKKNLKRETILGSFRLRSAAVISL
jgi:hypothetical protein